MARWSACYRAIALSVHRGCGLSVASICRRKKYALRPGPEAIRRAAERAAILAFQVPSVRSVADRAEKHTRAIDEMSRRSRQIAMAYTHLLTDTV
jgi:hypothetical protein